MAARPVVAAVVSSVERATLDAMSAGCFAILHRSSLPEALRVVRERPVDAVLVSVHECRAEQADVLDSLVRGFPEVPTVALVTKHDPALPALLLRLGATGVRQVVDVTSPAGWGQLRRVVAEPTSRSTARILAGLFDCLPELASDTRLFLETLVRLAPSTPAVRSLATHSHTRPSTLMSRFHRAGLPSPKMYLAAVRLLYAAHFFEWDGLSIADVAYRLEYSSPQSFGRHLRAMMGITPGEFRRRFPFALAMNRFVEVMVTPYQSVWRSFHPVETLRPSRAD